MGRKVPKNRHGPADDEPIEYDWVPMHQCGEPMRHVGRSQRMYCPKCDLKKAGVASSVASFLAEKWNSLRDRMEEVSSAMDDLMNRTDDAGLGDADLQCINYLYFCLGELFDEAFSIEIGIQERRGESATGSNRMGPPQPQVKRRVVIRIKEVTTEGLEL